MTDEDVLRGNSVIVKCLIPSFVSDYVRVVEWVATDDSIVTSYSFNGSEDNYGNREYRAAPIVPIRTPNPQLQFDHRALLFRYNNKYILQLLISSTNRKSMTFMS